MRNKTKKKLPQGAKTALKWLFYTASAFILFALSTSGTGEKPTAVAILPFCIAVSCFSGEVESAALGALGGILADISQGRLMGFTGLYLCLACGLASALFRQFLRKNIINYLILDIVICALYLYIDYFFFFRIWDFEGHEAALELRLLPALFKNYLWSPIIYAAVKLCDRLAAPDRTLEIEESDARIDRV